MAIRQDIGIVTAYGYAVSKGYEGTEEEFAQAMADVGINVSEIEASIKEFNEETVPAAMQSIIDEGNARVANVTAEGTRQMNAVAQRGANEILAVENAGTTQIGLVNEAGASQVEAVNSAGTTQVGNVNTAGGTQVAAVQAKGQEVIDSIPSDYSALTQEVSDLNQALFNYNSCNLIEMIMPSSKNDTINGITYTYSGGVTNITNTSTAESSFDFFAERYEMPPYFKAGEKYYIKTECSDSRVGFMIAVFNSGGTGTWIYDESGNSGGIITIPSDTGGMRIRLIVASGQTFTNVKARFVIKNAYSNEELSEIVVKNNPYTVGSTGCDFNSFTDALAYAYSIGDCTLMLANEEFNIIDEHTIVAGEKGLLIGNGVHIIGQDGTVLKCEYTGNDGVIQREWSILYAMPSDFTIENVKFIAKNIRYCVHDDTGSRGEKYTHKYINCDMYHDSHDARWRTPQCIGGGFGINGTCIVDGGVYESVPLYESTTTDIDGPYSSDLKYEAISWHSNNGDRTKPNKLIIKNVYTKGIGSKVIVASGDDGEVMVYGNSFGAAIGQYGNAGTVYAWNNEIRTN